jgi:hypothetical protein
VYFVVILILHLWRMSCDCEYVNIDYIPLYKVVEEVGLRTVIAQHHYIGYDRGQSL